MADGEKSEREFQGSDEARPREGRRHDADPAAEADVRSDRDRSEDRAERESNRSSSSEVAAVGRAVAQVEEILDGEIDDPQQVERVIAEQHWEGPLPPPAAIAAYEEVMPGAADRAFRLAERNMDLKMLRAETVRAAVDGEVVVETITAEADRDALKRGQYLAAGISALIGALSFAGLFLTPWAAVGFVVPLAQVAGALVRTVSDPRPQPPTEDRPKDE